MRWRWVSGVMAAALVLAACSSDDGADDGSAQVDAAAACGEVERPAEPGGNTHVINPEAATFEHHPPAAGPHFSGNPPEAGVHDEPIPEAVQVTALEFGNVIVNYVPDLDEVDRSALEALTEQRSDVIVAPAAVPIDDGAAVALTAWEHRQLCDDVSVIDAEAFIAEFAGQGPGEVVEDTNEPRY